MKAAVLHEYGVPRVDEFQEPVAGPGQAVVDVLAAGLNPVDVAICAGRFYAGNPPLPSVAGREGVGMLEAIDLSAALADAAEGRIDVVLDPLFGEPFVAAVNAASFGARLVQIGAGAGAEATLPSAAIRGKMLVIMGHANFAAPPEVKRNAYRQLVEAAADGGLSVEVDPLPLERVAEAWQRLADGSHRKIVLVP